MANPLIEKLASTHGLEVEEYEALIQNRTPEDARTLAQLARETVQAVYGRKIFVRGLIEISNLCKNDCFYCGIRRSNRACERYRLSPEQILACAQEGYRLGFRTIVMQGGEDAFFTDALLCQLIQDMKSAHPDLAVTLSLGERSRESYQRLFDAGADRYLLRHETATKSHYEALHPNAMSFEHRMRCLKDLHEIGYQTGCGFMVGSPGQTNADLARDLKFVEQFQPEMCGIGPFIPHKDTPFRAEAPGSVELTCYLLSILRLIKPNLLLPATTALGSIDPVGREKGIRSGANVVMPNLSPQDVRNKYMLYNNKLSSGPEAAQNLQELKTRMAAIGYEIVEDRGDIQP